MVKSNVKFLTNTRNFSSFECSVNSLVKYYFNKWGVNEPAAITILLSSELITADIAKYKASQSQLKQIWFDKCEQIFRNKFEPKSPPPASPALRLVA
ncbi:hypothetical protein [Colwellia sp. RSH04]|uniref:hypothetical protein n=1 Tax=Colwellia sp. RSH04 TaxID=2305464 RepID=UPI000E58D16D|nr:hypothetical protein [Colwellia sp. RSH04]RHW76466.1 hypothetical protein D1094_09150 [Colwellia sp. RSH04]